MDYFEYINSPLWAERKRQYYEDHKKQCRACGGYRDIQLHHIFYTKWGQEPDNALVPLCTKCHTELHEWRSPKGNLIKQTYYFIAKKQALIKAISGTNILDNT